MAFRTFVPPFGGKFSQGTSRSHEPKVLSAGFGDGYAQEAGDGLNADLATLQIQFNVQTWVEGRQILQFFKEHKGYIPFWFQLPEDLAPKKWKARKWNIAYTTEKTVDVTATWQEVVDPE